MTLIDSPVRRLAYAVAAVLLAARLAAQATITVDATQRVRYVDDRMFGINAVMWDGNTANPQTISLLQSADVRMVRIPGGSLSDGYHWTSGLVEDNTYQWPAATDAFAALITSLKANATVVANYGTGTPEEAAAWVAYLNAPATLQGTTADVALGTDSKGTNWRTAGYWSALRAAAKLGTDDGLNFLRIGQRDPVGAQNWEIGNECYGTWETDKQAVPHDPYTYANRAKDYIAKMRAVDPTIRIGVVVVPGEDSNVNNTSHPVTNPRTNAVHNGWTPVLLATLKSLGITPDALVYHRYEQSPGRETDAGLLQIAKTWPNDAADLRQQLSDYLGSAGAAVELVVTENNSVYSDPGKQSTSIVNALFYADALGNILQTEFNEYCWWALRNGAPTTNVNNSASLYGWRQYGDYGIISMPNSFGETSNFEGYPVYYMMKLASHFARGGDAIIKASSSSTLLSAFAAKRTNGTVTILVVNKDPANDMTATISVAGFTPKTTARLHSYGIPQDEAARTGTGSVDVASSTIANAGTSFSLTFPHYSATVITLAQSAPVITVQPAGGSVGTGASVTLSVVANGFQPLTYQWMKDGVAISGATAQTVSTTATVPANSGAYTVVVTDGAGTSVTSAAASLTVSSVAEPPAGPRLFNISTRAQVGTGGNVMIAGFTLAGAGSKKVLIRAVGPGLAQYGVGGTLPDPQLEVTTSAGDVIMTNDNWGEGDAAAISAAGQSVGAFSLPNGSKDAAAILTLPNRPGGYTAIVSGANSGTGVALVEVYDLDTGSAARLFNLSTRSQAGAGDQQMIGGFAVSGSTPRKVLLRAVGPTLSNFSLTGVLPDPTLSLTLQNGTVIASNDDWETPVGTGMADGPTITTASQQTGAFGLNAGGKDSAILTSLTAGTYTGLVAGKAGASGIALFEAYEAP